MRSYEKSNPQKTFAEPILPKTVKSEKLSAIPIRDAGLHYTKKEGKQMPFSFIVIVSGGEVREKNYF